LWSRPHTTLKVWRVCSTLTVTSVAHSKLAREIAAAATVMLKNRRGVLPILPSGDVKRIAVIGVWAKTPTVHGGGSSQVTPAYVVSPLQGITERAPRSGVVEVSFNDGSDYKVRLQPS
jgi:beta-glucosidase